MELLLILLAAWLLGGFDKSKSLTNQIKQSFNYSTYDWASLCIMDSDGFEKYCASWLRKKHGYMCEVTGRTGDNNIDIKVKDSMAKLLGIAECKHWKGKVGAKQVKVLYATMLDCNVNQGWFFSLNGFSDGCRKYTESLIADINLIEGKEMVSVDG